MAMVLSRLCLYTQTRQRSKYVMCVYVYTEKGVSDWNVVDGIGTILLLYVYTERGVSNETLWHFVTVRIHRYGRYVSYIPF